MNTEPLVVERTYNAPASKIWKALTDKAEMKQWYFDVDDFKPQPHFVFRFEGGTETHKYVHVCEVTEAIPNRRLQYTWRYEGYPGLSTVTFELFEEGKQTRVRITHAGLETFPSDNPDFRRSNFEGGWNEILGTMLTTHLQKTPE